jgi:type IV secretion system protein VirB11
MTSAEKFIQIHLKDIIAKPGVTEISYNGDDQIYYFENNRWHNAPTTLNYDIVSGFAQTVASYNSNIISTAKPILSASLPTRERIQFLMPPALEKDKFAFSIRVPSKIRIPYDRFVEQGLFDNTNIKSQGKETQLLQTLFAQTKYEAFIEEAVKQEKTIVISGETGSGKTTFMKSLLEFIPTHERVMSIEDVDEITFFNHPNHLKLYYPEGASVDSYLNASTLLKACLRLFPDRILLAELRGAEAFDYMNIISSGHRGSITSCHAGNIDETFSRIALMVLQNERGQKIPYEIILQMLRDLIDVVVHIEFNPETNTRYIDEIYYRDAA